ncbi:MAG: CPBP family intramembrane metalloprotease [Planctomycetes bacterium]|nr:CPBP family intramembrane metalloprotease [Planctomycetota bacterium]
MTATPADTRIRDWAALAFTSIFPLLMAYIYFVVLQGTKDKSVLFAFGVGKVVQFAFPVVYAFWFERERLRFARPTWRGIPIALAFALMVGAGMYPLYFFLVQHIPSVADETPAKIYNVLQQMDRATPTGYLLMAFFVCVPHALMEEYYWRWFVYGTMRRHVPIAAAVVLASIGFMLHHIVILAVYFPGNF